MLKFPLLASRKGRAQKQEKFVRQTAKVVLLLILFLAVFLLTKDVLAQNQPQFGLDYAKATGLGTEDIRIIITRIIRAALGFLGIVALVIIIYGGYRYMTSQGNPEKVQAAKKILINAVIGIIIILLAFAIVQFILSYLTGISGAGYKGRPTYGSAGGALGNGIIESHYPERNAVNIPRNTSIVVTFKEKIQVASVISDTNGSGTLGDCDDSNGNGQFDFVDTNKNGVFDADDSAECDLLNRDSVKIRKTKDNANSGPFVEFVRASFTADQKTFVFKPVEYLGSESESISYTVLLAENILKDNGSKAFGGFNSYSWKFEVSTRVDITPPQVKSVVPKFSNNSNQSVPRNQVVQINFNEPINPMTIRGTVALEGGATVGNLEANSYQIILACKESLAKDCNASSSQIIAGEFLYSNNYQTVEFVTNDLCGQNTCGGDVFCLPGSSFLTVLISAAGFSNSNLVNFPYDGVVDMAENSLDGNKNSKSSGPGSNPYYLNLPPQDSTGIDDSAMWSFYTNNNIELSPPQIVSYYPTPKAQAVDPGSNFEATFDRYIMAATLRAGGEGYCPCTDNNQCGTATCGTEGYCLESSGKKYVCSTPCAANQACFITKKYVILVQPSETEIATACPSCDIAGWPYWVKSSNNETNTSAIIDHDVLAGKLNFKINVGSGVKDLFQNCYQPCSGPSCQKIEIGPGQYEVSPGNWRPNDDSYPTCDLTTP